MDGQGADAPGQSPERQDGAAPRPSYYRRNPWRPFASGAFAGAASLLTVTTLFYAAGMLSLLAVGIAAVLAVALFGFGLHARRRAARFDADIA